MLNSKEFKFKFLKKKKKDRVQIRLHKIYCRYNYITFSTSNTNLHPSLVLHNLLATYFTTS